MLDEPYIAKAAVAARWEMLHFRDYFGGVKDLAERTALVLDPAHIA